MSDEINPDLTALLAEALGREVYGVIVVRSEHDPACPGGGDYCASHCPVPVQDYGEVDEVAAHLAEQITAAGFGPVRAVATRARAEALREHRCKPCGCAWCCANVPTERRGETHQRTCQPHRADSLAPDTAGENNNPRRQGDA